MIERYVIRPDSRGFSVIELATGAPAVIAMAPQRGLTQEDANHLAGLLNAPTPESATAAD
ncbi:MAG: hypothetical protein AB1942_22565 [Pseudomonadota bacterium]